MLIREVMTTPAATVTTKSSTGAALRLMHEEQLSAIPVVDDRGALIGVISETELLHDRALVDGWVPVSAGRIPSPPPSRRVGDALQHHVVTVSPDDKIEVAIALMRSTMLEQLPVVEKDRVVGTIGRSDLIRLLPQPSICCEFEASAGTASAGAVRSSPATD
jgi:predicted transcriptional regulator